MSLEQLQTIADLFFWSALANGLVSFGMIGVAIILAWHLRQHRLETKRDRDALRVALTAEAEPPARYDPQGERPL